MRMKELKHVKKRVLSVALVMGMIVTMLPSDGIMAAARKEISDATKGDTIYEYNTYLSGTDTKEKKVTRERRVIKDLSTDGIIKDKNKSKGSVENPLLVLEVVPYKDYSSIGYLAEGCEPVNMRLLAGNKLLHDTLVDEDGDFFGFGKFESPYYIDTAGTKQLYSVYFFDDEEEGKREFYQNTNLTSKALEGIDSHKSKLRFSDDEWKNKMVTNTEIKKYEDLKKQGGVYGYYEVVNKGEGTFILKTETKTGEDGSTGITGKIEKATDANKNQATLVWHTMNSYEVAQLVNKEGQKADRFFLTMENLTRPASFAKLKIDLEGHPDYVGNRFYTVRPIEFKGEEPNKTSDLYDVTGDYYLYTSYDLFARNTLGLSASAAKDYSICVKTITPFELNANLDWIDKADLIYFNADLTVFKDKDKEGNKKGVKDDDEGGLIDIWQSMTSGNKKYMNRFNFGNMLDSTGKPEPANAKGFRGKYNNQNIPKLRADASTDESYRNKSREISLEAFYKILERVSKVEDYLAVIFDQNVVSPAYNDKSDGKAYSLYYLGEETAKRTKLSAKQTFGSTGYKTNLAKLWIACTSANPGLVKKYFIDNGSEEKGQIEKDTDGIIRFSKDKSRVGISDNERNYWSGYTFYCMEADFPRDAKAKDDYWRKYAGHATLTDSDDPEDCYYVQGHVFVTPSGMNLVEDYAKSYSNDKLSYAGTKYKDFNEFLAGGSDSKELKANTASSSLATKYILDPDKVVNYYLDMLNVLDVEPSVKMKSNTYDLGLTGDDCYDWTFTDKDVYKLIPKRMGTDTGVAITHMVMPGFIGKNEDINSIYDLIYMGADAGGLWTGKEVKDNYFSTDKNYIKNNAKAGESRTDFADNDMDGLVYFHVGDVMYIRTDKNDKGKSVVNKVYDNQLDAAAFGNSTNTRQPGNDLTVKKMSDLIDYMNGEFPIVVADDLYYGMSGKNTDDRKPYVQEKDYCIMYRFLRTYDPEKNYNAATNAFENCYYPKYMLEQIDDAISNRMKGRVTISGLPKLYNTKYGVTATTNKSEIYLDTSDGRPVLNFTITVPNATDYEYRVFVDRNRDGLFTASTSDDTNEVITTGYIPLDDDDLENDVTAKLSEKWVGFVQWRVEVVNKANRSKRYSKTGCSAVAAQEGEPVGSDRGKQKIKALQIMPTHSSSGSENSKSWVDLSNRNWDGSAKANNTWNPLYAGANDFDIEVIAITWRQFNQLFKEPDPTNTSAKFVFHMGSEINISDEGGNPKKSILETIERRPINFVNDKWKMPDEPEKYYKLEDFNMIVLGFDDAYGLTDMSNDNGCVEYLYYFAEKGCSILFTHDTTSQHSARDKAPNDLGWVKMTSHKDQDPWYEQRIFGYTGNTLMREIMGLNRYMVQSKFLTTDRDTDTHVNFRTDLAADIKSFVNNKVDYDNKGANYSSVISDYAGQLHGYTMFNLLRYQAARQGGTVNITQGGKIARAQYKYIVLNPNDGGKTKYPDGGAFTVNTITQLVSMVNEGQITQYPYTIGASGAKRQFVVGATHSQWWQLNMEDKDLTVWYVLDDPAMSNVPGSSIKSTYYNARSGYENDKNDLMYSVVPGDVSNNYYIFSKGNIFYSGVGHRQLQDDAYNYEKKLFVNTLVAAYRPKFGLPYIQVTDEHASLIDKNPRTYGITAPVDYVYNSDGTINSDASDIIGASSSFYKDGCLYVKFTPCDTNGCSVIYTSAHIAKNDGTASNIALEIYSPNETGGPGSPVASSKKVDGKDFCELTVGKDYYVKYPKAYLFSADKNKVIFESFNNRVTSGEMDSTYLEMSSQPLFNLD